MQRIVGLIKVVLAGAAIKSKIDILIKMISVHFQIKFFVVALVGLLINVFKFFVDLKHKHPSQKVLYYEQAHHDHHYDKVDVEDGDGHDDGGYYYAGASPSSSAWRRSIQDDAHNIVYSGYKHLQKKTL